MDGPIIQLVVVLALLSPPCWSAAENSCLKRQDGSNYECRGTSALLYCPPGAPPHLVGCMQDRECVQGRWEAGRACVPQIQCEAVGNFSLGDSVHCDVYYACSDKGKVAKISLCPPQQHFNPVKSACVPAPKNSCATRPAPTCQMGTRLPDPQDCSRYLACHPQTGEAMSVSCYQGLLYDEKRHTCVAETDCGDRPRHDTPISSTMAPTVATSPAIVNLLSDSPDHGQQTRGKCEENVGYRCNPYKKNLVQQCSAAGDPIGKEFACNMDTWGGEVCYPRQGTIFVACGPQPPPCIAPGKFSLVKLIGRCDVYQICLEDATGENYELLLRACPRGKSFSEKFQQCLPTELVECSGESSPALQSLKVMSLCSSSLQLEKQKYDTENEVTATKPQPPETTSEDAPTTVAAISTTPSRRPGQRPSTTTRRAPVRTTVATTPRRTQSTTQSSGSTTTRRPTPPRPTPPTRRPAQTTSSASSTKEVEAEEQTTTPIPCTPGSRQEDPHHCGKYYWCNGRGQLQPRVCLRGQFYDVTRNRCMTGSNVDCGDRPESTEDSQKAGPL